MKKITFILFISTILMSLTSLSLQAQTFDFNGSDSGFTASNFSQATDGGQYITYELRDLDDDGYCDSDNPSFRNQAANIDTSVGDFIAITMRNMTGNTRVQAIATVAGVSEYTSYNGLTTNDSAFTTYYIDMSGNANWSGTLDDINFRFKELANGAPVLAGYVYFDNIEVVAAVPADADCTTDTTAPVAYGQNLTVLLTADNTGSLVGSIEPSDLNFGSTDDCSDSANLIYHADITEFTCQDIGDVTVGFYVEDEAGNTSLDGAGTALSLTVTVTEEIDPVATAQDITVALDANGSYTLTAAEVNNGSTDSNNCTADEDLTLSP